MELSPLTLGDFPFITEMAYGHKHIVTTLTRANFEELCSDILDRYVISINFITSKLVKSLTGNDPDITVNHDEVAALGAAVQVSFNFFLIVVHIFSCK
ncbi:hypothetical protein MKX03_025157 [Papaver bracteatum]|nr:hypothetical protein MKX03_025157 [Papaver bracteatum]